MLTGSLKNVPAAEREHAWGRGRWGRGAIVDWTRLRSLWPCMHAHCIYILQPRKERFHRISSHQLSKTHSCKGVPARAADSVPNNGLAHGFCNLYWSPRRGRGRRGNGTNRPCAISTRAAWWGSRHCWDIFAFRTKSVVHLFKTNTQTLWRLVVRSAESNEDYGASVIQVN